MEAEDKRKVSFSMRQKYLHRSANVLTRPTQGRPYFSMTGNHNGMGVRCERRLKILSSCLSISTRQVQNIFQEIFAKDSRLWDPPDRMRL